MELCTKNDPLVFGYLKNCNKKSMMHTAKYMHQILNLSLDAYDEIFQEFDISNLVEKKELFTYGLIKI